MLANSIYYNCAKDLEVFNYVQCFFKVMQDNTQTVNEVRNLFTLSTF